MSQMDQLATREQKCKTTFNQHVSLFIRCSFAFFTAQAHVAAHSSLKVTVHIRRVFRKNKTKTAVMMHVSMLSLPGGLWAVGGEAQHQVVQLYQDPFPEGQEAVTHSTTHQPQLSGLSFYNSHLTLCF